MAKETGHFVRRSISSLSRALNIVGVSTLMIVMILTVADVSLRYLVNHPIAGTFELTEFLLVILASFGFAYTALQNGHVTVDLVIERFSPKIQAVIDTITSLISIGVFVTVTWASILYARSEWKAKAVSTILLLPRFPFILVVAVGCAVLCLALLVNLLNSVNKVVKK
jgi:TRAP-type C4-dicarboxylate transport system permease small subunit